MNHFILSPCGTSILTNQVSVELRKILNKYSNYRKEEEIPEEDLCLITEHITKRKQEILNADIQQATILSAELNGIIKYYDGSIQAKNDFYQLIGTDTYFGRVTTEIVAEWLRKRKLSLDIYIPEGLRTQNIREFQLALSEIVKWCEDSLLHFKEKKYHIVFNLTGGFKSIQGFLQTLAMFYADESIYVFESGKELLRLPRLPVKLDPNSIVENNISAFRKIYFGLKFEIPIEIPELMLLKMDDEIVFSDYGQVIFQQTKRNLYQRKIYEPVIKNIKFGPEFLDSTANLSGNRLRILNERIDDLTSYLLSNRKKNLNRLDFKKLSGNPKPPSTHEIDAWADQDAPRIYGHFENEIFILDEFGPALH